MSKFQGEINSYVADAIATRYHFVKETTDGRNSAADLAGAGEKTIGILTEDVALGGDMPVCEEGFGLLEVNGNGTNIAIGDPIKSAAGGVGVKADTEGDFYGATAKEAATTDGAIIKVRIERGYVATA